MKIRHMQWIDQRVGALICLTLGAMGSVIPRFRRASRRNVARIVVLKFFGIGSMVFLTPLFRALRRAYPKARLTFVTFESNRRTAELFQMADEICTVRSDHPLVFMKDLLGLLWFIVRRRFDIAIDAEFFSKFSAILAYLSGAPVRAGYYSPGMSRSVLLTERVYYNHYRHITEVFLSLARAVGAEGTDPEPSRLALPKEIREMDVGVRPARSFIVVNVNTSELCLERRWPAPAFVELSNRLLDAYPEMDFVFIGDDSERPYVGEIVSRIASDRAVDLAGRTTVDQLMAVLQRASLVVSNDSGPLHIACALGTPTVALFGPETPLLYGPKGPSNITLYKGIHCSPCLNVYTSKIAPCNGDNQCMKQIPVEDVFGAVKEALARRAPAR